MAKKKNMKKDTMIRNFILIAATLCLVGFLYYRFHSPFFSTYHSYVDADVILDPGHGGYDSGSTYNGILEKDVVLELSLDIGEELEANGIKVAYTRMSDDVSWSDVVQEDLQARVDISNHSSAKAYVSIHTNASESKQGKGFEIWSYTRYAENKALAKAIKNEVLDTDMVIDRGIKNASSLGLYVLKYNDKPSVLVEAGFLESDHDRMYLMNPRKRKQLAKAIAQGIIDYLQNNEESK